MDSSLFDIQSVVAAADGFNAQTATQPTTLPAGTSDSLTPLIPEWLQYIDYRLLWIGGLTLVALLLWFAHQAPKNPLAGPSRRKNSLPPEMFILPFLVFLLSGSIANEAAKYFLGKNLTDGVRQTFFCFGWLAGISTCLLLGHRFYDKGMRGFLLGETGILRATASGAIYYLASIPLVTGAYYLGLAVITAIDPNYQLNDHAALTVLHDPTEPSWVHPWIWISAVALAPIGEECYFRGILQSVMQRVTDNKWITITIVSLLFGAAHATQLHAIFPLAVFGFVLGFACERTGTLWTPIVIHFLFNFKTLMWDSLAPSVS